MAAGRIRGPDTIVSGPLNQMKLMVKVIRLSRILQEIWRLSLVQVSERSLRCS